MPYFNPPNNGSIQTQNRVERGNIEGAEFDFSNESSVAASGYFSIDIRSQTKYLDALNHAPFNAISISNNSAQDILMYLNTTYPASTAKKIFVANRTDRLYDLAKITSVCIENQSTTTAINANEIRMLFVKSSMNVDRLAEQLGSSLAPYLSKPKPIYKLGGRL